MMFNDSDNGQTQYCPMCEEWANKYDRLKSEYSEVLDAKCGTIAALKVENDELKKLTGVYSTRKIKALESENDELKKLLEEQGKIINCKTGTIQSLAKIRDELKAENEKLKEQKNEYYQNNLTYERQISELIQVLEYIYKMLSGHKIADEVRIKSILYKIDEVLKCG